MLVCGSVTPARATPVREYLDEAQATTIRIELAGDQSAALGLIARTLADLDPRAALDVIARTRRPSDAARSLGATAVALAPSDSDAAADAAQAAGRLLMRIAEAEQRALEQELLLWEIAVLGEDALSAAPELRTGEAQLAVVLGLTESDPAAALALVETWQLAGGPRDEAVAAVARQLAPTDPDQALELVTSIASARMRDFTLWRMAEKRPAEESTNIALRIFDPLVRSSLTASAAAREAGDDPDAAQAAALGVSVAGDSAVAQLAVATAETDIERALSMARGLPERPRAWGLARIALLTARETPALAESLLSEIEADAETVRVVLSRLAEAEPARALRLARSLPAGPQRDAALAAVVRALAPSDPELAEQLVWEMESPRWRARAVRPLAGSLAATDCDAATALLGLVLDPGAAGRIRADIAAVAAADDPGLSARLLTSLPPSDYRNDAALEAAAVVLREGGPAETAAQLAAVGLSRDIAMRWLLPELARAQTRSPINLAEYIAEAFPRAIALVDVAREMLEVKSTARPAPDRARQIRPIVEWEGR
jgi:hypothetical protein